MFVENDDDDFYLVLPSNASPDTQPNNNAADYVIDYANPIKLNPSNNWKVALTELSYIYSPATISSDYCIKYEQYEEHKYTWDVKLNIQCKRYVKLNEMCLETVDYAEPPAHLSGFTIIIQNSNIIFRHATPFVLSMLDKYFSELGIDDKVSRKSNENNFYEVRGTKSIQPIIAATIQNDAKPDVNDSKKKKSDIFSKILKTFYVSIDVYTYSNRINYYPIPTDKNFDNPSQLFNFVQSNCKNIFKEVSTNPKTNVMMLRLAKRVHDVTFLGGFNFALGFSNYRIISPLSEDLKHPELDIDPSWYIADYPPQLNRGVQNMYVYASVCKPIHVGHTLVPLLKNVFVDASKDASGKGHARNYAVYNPMYIPVASTTINRIEINIRNDAGQLISFPKGAITSITLHFIKTS